MLGPCKSQTVCQNERLRVAQWCAGFEGKYDNQQNHCTCDGHWVHENWRRHSAKLQYQLWTPGAIQSKRVGQKYYATIDQTIYCVSKQMRQSAWTTVSDVDVGTLQIKSDNWPNCCTVMDIETTQSKGGDKNHKDNAKIVLAKRFVHVEAMQSKLNNQPNCSTHCECWDLTKQGRESEVKANVVTAMNCVFKWMWQSAELLCPVLEAKKSKHNNQPTHFIPREYWDQAKQERDSERQGPRCIGGAMEGLVVCKWKLHRGGNDCYWCKRDEEQHMMVSRMLFDEWGLSVPHGCKNW